MVDITYLTLYENSFKLLRDLLIDKVTDPKNRFKISLIRDSRQFSSATNFTGYPYIVLHPTNISEPQQMNDRKKGLVTFSFTLEVLGDAEDLSNFDKLSNDIIFVLNNVVYQQTLADGGLSRLRIDSSPAIDEVIDGNVVYVRTFTITFTRILDINLNREANFGERGDDDNGSVGCENKIVGGQFTCPHDGLALSITAKLIVATTEHKLKCALYDSSGNFVAETEEKTIPVQGKTWTTFNFTATPTLVRGKVYIICGWAEATTGTCKLRMQTGTGTRKYAYETYNSWPSTVTFTSAINLMHVYCTYTY